MLSDGYQSAQLGILDFGQAETSCMFVLHGKAREQMSSTTAWPFALRHFELARWASRRNVARPDHEPWPDHELSEVPQSTSSDSDRRFLDLGF